jgi:hypothetical protein
MSVPNRSDIAALLEREGECVSILLPTHRAGKEVQQAKIRLKNLLREAEGRLNGNHRRRDEVEAMLRPGHDLLADEGRWRSLEDGLALYLAPGFSESFTVPAKVDETLITGKRFYVVPLLPLVENRASFLVLALSLKNVRLFACERFAVEEMELPGVPKNLTDAVGTDYEEDNVQIHTTSRTGAGGAIVHGHGVGAGEDDKQEAARFCKRVDSGLRAVIGSGPRPMVLAAAEPLASLFRQASHYANLAQEVIPGNPDLATPEEMQARGWSIVERLAAEERADELARLRELLGTGRASVDTREILVGAFDGRVDTLFIAEGARQWGSFDAESRNVEIGDEGSAGSEEILNLGAAMTLRASGAVRLAPREALPEHADVAAIFRY